MMIRRYRYYRSDAVVATTTVATTATAAATATAALLRFCLFFLLLLLSLLPTSSSSRHSKALKKTVCPCIPATTLKKITNVDVKTCSIGNRRCRRPSVTIASTGTEPKQFKAFAVKKRGKTKLKCKAGKKAKPKTVKVKQFSKCVNMIKDRCRDFFLCPCFTAEDLKVVTESYFPICRNYTEGEGGYIGSFSGRSFATRHLTGYGNCCRAGSGKRDITNEQLNTCLSLIQERCKALGCDGGCCPNGGDEKEFRFTSCPDFFNWNIGYPQPGWEEAIKWFLGRLKTEGPSFTLNAGDIMDARWWNSPQQVRTKTEQYWCGFKKRFEDEGIRLFVAPGDHEYGDNSGLEKVNIAREFGKQFTKIFDFPMNGPEGHKGRAYWFRKGGLAVITLDTFVDMGERFDYTIGETQYKWLESVLKKCSDAEFVIVQGHLPIAGPVRSKNSSSRTMKGGTKSTLWKLLVEHGVDFYFAGEHHRITVIKRDGIFQIVHGALWGMQEDVNYLRGHVKPGELTLELLEFNVSYDGGRIGDHPHRGAKGPREKVSISEQARTEGPRQVGKLVIKRDANGTKQVVVKTGHFDVSGNTNDRQTDSEDWLRLDFAHSSNTRTASIASTLLTLPILVLQQLPY